ncbi:DUF1294 domain-containing protein [Peteryoungia desertarenae]|uniref:DUF1294 domain-containing protein n=1 Tax=Peteryoungia desertarenae TaxID=1813451 RepID=A0ABX6QPR9_9HYPH|nr:DUF1294 domain-containing protein [Peteryoungia desertarenae]QLF70150.1 DUF1294 domain-containing protein [Peteryoungia desertarenae]
MTSQTMLTLIAILVLWNVIVFCVYAYDKTAAREGARRVREDTLITLAVLGGGPGAWACQKVLRHKTRKPPFRILLPALALIQLPLAVICLVFPQAVLAWLRSLLNLLSGLLQNS